MLRILCLDSDGGHGGSSRSLFYIVKNLLKEDVSITVWGRRDLGLKEEYENLRVNYHTMPTMGKISPLPRLSRDLIDHAMFMKSWLLSSKFRFELLSAAKDFDLIHFNHENLVFTAYWLSKHSDIPICCHIRTMAWDYKGITSRLHARLIGSAADGLIFISTNEKKSFNKFSNVSNEAVILNPTHKNIDLQKLNLRKPKSRTLKVICVSNFSWVRGTDRVIDIAFEVKRQRANAGISFKVVGDIEIDNGGNNITLKKIASSGGTLIDYVKERDVEDLVQCVGFKRDIGRELDKSDILIKPTRENNPWGRDIIEAMAHGLPVISVGKDTLFVETGKTGLLQAEFNASEVASFLIKLSESQDDVCRLGKNSASRISKLCDAKHRSQDILFFWQTLVQNKIIPDS